MRYEGPRLPGTTPAPNPRKARPPRWLFFVVPVASALLGMALFEVALRVAVTPSPRSYGVLRGRELPPVLVVPVASPVRPDPDAPWGDLVVGGRPVTHGDLYGFMREHPRIGYVWEENRASANGWWRTNEIGARSDRPTPREVLPGTSRVVVFGESFAAATRLPHDETWAARLQTLRPDLDVVNLGTDGYSTAQAVLLFREVSERIDYDVALFLFVPWHDPWRDVNVVRSLGEAWNSHTPMPRFILDGDGLRLVPPLYERAATTYERNYPKASRELLDHLRAHDRFYLPDLHEPPPILGSSVLWKFLAARKAAEARRRIRMEIGTDLDGEAFAITWRLFATAREEAARRGQRVVVGVLPVQQDVRNLSRSEPARERWDGILRRLHSAGMETLDLAPALLAAPASDLDEGYDGSHFGPRANARIAEALAAGLPR